MCNDCQATTQYSQVALKTDNRDGENRHTLLRSTQQLEKVVRGIWLGMPDDMPGIPVS